jgi:hypothetical protein
MEPDTIFQQALRQLQNKLAEVMVALAPNGQAPVAEQYAPGGATTRAGAGEQGYTTPYGDGANSAWGGNTTPFGGAATQYGGNTTPYGMAPDGW